MWEVRVKYLWKKERKTKEKEGRKNWGGAGAEPNPQPQVGWFRKIGSDSVEEEAFFLSFFLCVVSQIQLLFSLSLSLLLVMFSMGGFLILIYDKYKFNFFNNNNKKCSNNVTKKEEIIGWEMKILKMMKIAWNR